MHPLSPQDLRPWCQHADATSATSQQTTDSDTPEKQIYDVLNYKEKPEMILYYTGFSFTLCTSFGYSVQQYQFFQLKEINIWPSRDIITQPMPKQFAKQFPTTRVILDATEIPIHKPTNVKVQSATYRYKNRKKL